MAWLVLSYEMDREVDEVPQAGRDSRFSIKPTGPTHAHLKMIDTDTGKVTEIKYEIVGGQIKERAPVWGETHAADQILGKSKQIEVEDRVRARAAAAEKTEARLRLAKAHLTEAQNRLARTERELQRLRGAKTPTGIGQSLAPPGNNGFTAIEKDLMAAGIDHYMDFLLDNDQRKSYRMLAAIYERLTGVPRKVGLHFDQDGNEIDEPE